MRHKIFVHNMCFWIQFLLNCHITDEEEELSETASSLGENAFTTGLAGSVEVGIDPIVVLGGAFMGGTDPTTAGGPCPTESAPLGVGAAIAGGGPAACREIGGGGGML